MLYTWNVWTPLLDSIDAICNPKITNNKAYSKTLLINPRGQEEVSTILPSYWDLRNLGFILIQIEIKMLKK